METQVDTRCLWCSDTQCTQTIRKDLSFIGAPPPVGRADLEEGPCTFPLSDIGVWIFHHLQLGVHRTASVSYYVTACFPPLAVLIFSS